MEFSMNFSTALKVFQLNILKQAGVSVLPQQLGLKTDPIADLQAKNTNSPFSKLLGQLGSGVSSLTVPTPPVPPSDLSDQNAVTQYQQGLLTYQNNFQLYHQRMSQLMLQQMQNLQEALSTVNQQKSATTSSEDSVELGLGGILY
jgi:hypothetical protein